MASSTRLAIAMALVLLAVAAGAAAAEPVAPGTRTPELAGGAWINSEPLSMQALRGRVVLLDFWTYG